MPTRDGISEALERLRAGEEGALERLVPLIYDDLRRLARRQIGRHGPQHTLATTGLVHEIYLKLRAQRQTAWRDRGHFFAVAARAMRHVLIDHARNRRRQKRGGGQPHAALDEQRIGTDTEIDRVLAVDEALTRLAVTEERLARIVECRFFAGLTDEETAEALAISHRTVQRDWARARSWLKAEMGR
jgi:RNA polymerase sigma factor (TIGR02999 family)